MKTWRWQRHALAVLAASIFLLASGVWADDPSEARIKKDIEYLASEECEGRGVATKGIHKAADYIAEQFKKAGLKPANKDSYLQPFMMSTGSAKLEGQPVVRLRGPLGQEIELKQGQDFQVVGLSGSGSVSATVVFAGYGTSAERIGYDDFAGMDVAGKVLVILRKTPRADHPFTPFDGEMAEHHAALMTKLVNAGLRKAAAILFVSDTTLGANGDPLVTFRDHAQGGSPADFPAVHIRRSLVDDLLQASAGKSLREVEKAIDRTLTPASFPLTGWTALIETKVDRPMTQANNVVAVLEGRGKLAKETVVIGAHYDHLGYGGQGSLTRDKKPAIHFGADDNASGTAAMMELARRFAAKKDGERRRMVFIAFSGEESGLIGSKHYCKNPLFPLENTVAMLNLDMVGRLSPDKESNKDKLTIYGTATAKTFDQLLEDLNKKYDFKLQKVKGGTGPSDHDSFYRVKVPVFFFFTGDHKDYHRPSDTADKINVAGVRKIADMVEEIGETVAKAEQRPEYVEIRSSPMGTRGNVPRIGIRPGYGDEGEGVLVEGVTADGPAAKGGVKDGDRIVEIAGKSIKNLDVYMVVMGTQKKGQAMEMVVLRDGKKVTVKVTPE